MCKMAGTHKVQKQPTKTTFNTSLQLVKLALLLTELVSMQADAALQI